MSAIVSLHLTNKRVWRLIFSSLTINILVPFISVYFLLKESMSFSINLLGLLKHWYSLRLMSTKFVVDT